MTDRINGLLALLPSWARVALVLGLPTVAAAVLFGIVMGWVPSPLASQLTVHHDLLQKTDRDLTEHQKRQELLIEKLTLAMRVMCENNARDQSAIRNCGLIK
jgi:hypothetical protein